MLSSGMLAPALSCFPFFPFNRSLTFLPLLVTESKKLSMLVLSQRRGAWVVAAITDGLVAWIQFTITQALGAGQRGARDPDDSLANQRSQGSLPQIRVGSRCRSNKRPQRRFIDVRLAGERREGSLVSCIHWRSVARNRMSVYQKLRRVSGCANAPPWTVPRLNALHPVANRISFSAHAQSMGRVPRAFPPVLMLRCPIRYRFV